MAHSKDYFYASKELCLAIHGAAVATIQFHKTGIMKKNYRYLLILTLFILVPFGFSGYQDKDFELSKNLDIYHSLMRELNLYYVDEIDPGKVVKSSIDNMLAGLDPYTVYVPESQMEDLELMTTGEYGGVGALIRQRGEDVMITNPYENFPAQKAGLRAGDLIREIDGRSVADLSSSEISELMKGQVGTSLRMKVWRPHEKKEIKAELTREKIKINNVPHYQVVGDSTGYIRLGGFTQNASKEVLNAFTDLKEQGINNVILDLRANPGGLLIEAVDIMNIFVNMNEEIVSTRGKVKQWNNTYYCRRQAVDTIMPVAVLINSQSASASEIVAGAMQDLDRGVVLGQRSFGKGLVQTTRNLSYNSKLKITTAKYYIPSGRCIQALDYTHRREDGSVGKIPDSLITEFKTRNGRTVLDGGGIIPDYTTEPRVLSKLGSALIYQDKIFDFATRIRNTRPSMAEPSNFRLQQSDLDDFVEQLKQDSFAYETGSERKLAELESIVKAEKYDDLVGDQIEQLKLSLSNDLDKDVATFEQEIKDLLSEEILSRYYFQKGRIEFFLKTDPIIQKAIEILNNQTEYQKILQITP
jgi:carboxyl-terminal processing protease